MFRLRSCHPTFQSITNQILQKHPVSGTAKGKSKIKTGAPLKRSKITVKKGSSPLSPTTKKEYKSQDEILEDQCLNAPTPLRHLTPKQKKIESEREKLGLISESRKKEIENLKKQSKENNLNDHDKPDIIGTPGLDLVTLGLVDMDSVVKYELTVEDGRKLAKEYSRVLMRRHRERQAAESNLLRMKKEAIDALPEGKLKEAALVPDLSPFPASRFMATLTPPIEGYIEKVKEAAKKSSLKKKLR